MVRFGCIFKMTGYMTCGPGKYSSQRRGVFVSYRCCHTEPPPSGFKQHKFIPWQFCRSEVQDGFSWAKANNVIALWRRGENPFSCLFPLLDAACVPRLLAASTVRKAKMTTSYPTSHSYSHLPLAVSFDTWILKVLGLCHSLPKLFYHLYGCISATGL